MSADRILFENVSRFYGQVQGINRVTLSIPPGITSLVGPNGSGKTTLMNLMTGLVRPSRGTISMLGIAPLLLLEVEMPQAALHLDRIFAPLGSALQCIHGLIDLACRGLHHGRCQTRGGGRALFFGRIGSGVPTHEALNQVVVDKENL